MTMQSYKIIRVATTYHSRTRPPKITPNTQSGWMRVVIQSLTVLYRHTHARARTPRRAHTQERRQTQADRQTRAQRQVGVSAIVCEL